MGSSLTTNQLSNEKDFFDKIKRPEKKTPKKKNEGFSPTSLVDFSYDNGKNIQLYVSFNSVEVFEVEMNTNQYLRQLKEKVEKRMGVKLTNCEMYCNHQLLDADKKISYYRLVNYDTIIFSFYINYYWEELILNYKKSIIPQILTAKILIL